MDKEIFIEPRFDGARFAEHSLPLSAARDLAAYEDLVLELAKHLARSKNQDRARLPKGFASGFSLNLEKIEPGSARPVLVACMAGQLFPPGEITEARDLINRVIGTEEGQPLPPEFPKHLYSYFNRVGRSLRDGESIEWGTRGRNAVLTRAKRIRLASAHRETYEDEVEIVARVEELDAHRKTGNFRTEKGQQLPFGYSEPFFPTLKSGLGIPTHFYKVKGVGMFDINDTLQNLIEIEHIESLPHYHLTEAIENLSRLKDGWLEGHGKSFPGENLNRLANHVVEHYPEGLEHPAVVPTEEGHVVLEWIRRHCRIELEINFTDHQVELYATRLGGSQFEEKTYEWDQIPYALGRVAELLAP